eukprot:INCI7489.2.p1 GENE.INCI7489.2~~INCI7489.2.p1  ORF type:complete len:380 (-),score=58.58 INCI7489.2:1534-2568(-)
MTVLGRVIVPSLRTLLWIFVSTLFSGNAVGEVGEVEGDPGVSRGVEELSRRVLAATTPQPPEYNVKKFVVVTTARSGSGWTIRMLDSHPRISCQNLEPLGQFYDKYGAAVVENDIPWEKSDDGGYDGLSYRQFVDQVFDERCSTRAAALKGNELACGFKVLYSQIPKRHLHNFFHYMSKAGVAVIHLVRANVLRTEISWQFYLRDTDHGLASHTANASAGIRHPFRFDPAILHTKLVARIAAVQQFRALIQRYRPSDSIEIEYSAITRASEDLDPMHPLSGGGNPQCNELMAFLDPGLVGFNCQPDATQKHFVVQQHGYVKCEHEISNYDEVVEVSVATSVESL